LVKSVTCQVVAGWPWSFASTNLQLGIPLYHLLESVTVKPTYKRLQGGAGRPATPLGPLVSGLCTLPPHVRYTPGVTLILMKFQISL
jgi:hypothetical protein